ENAKSHPTAVIPGRASFLARAPNPSNRDRCRPMASALAQRGAPRDDEGGAAHAGMTRESLWDDVEDNLACAAALCPLPSLLAFRAPEGRASVLRETPDNAAAARGLAFLAFAVVDLERMLKIAELTRGLAMVTQRRAAGSDRLIEHRMDGADQPPRMIGGPGLSGRERRGQSSRRQLRPEQRFADIDVAEPCDHALVEQRRLEAGLPVGAGTRQHGGIECVAERFRTEPVQQRFILDRAAGDHLHVAEAARIVEDHGRARGHVKHHMIMGMVLAARMMELAWRLLVVLPEDTKRARHSQMHQQHVAGGEIDHQIFGAAAESGDGLALEPCHEVLLERKPQILAPRLDLDELGTLHRRLQSAADGFDFRQFRHASFTL